MAENVLLKEKKSTPAPFSPSEQRQGRDNKSQFRIFEMHSLYVRNNIKSNKETNTFISKIPEA